MAQKRRKKPVPPPDVISRSGVSRTVPITPEEQAAHIKAIVAAAPRLDGERRSFVRSLLMSQKIITGAGRHRRRAKDAE